MVADTPWSRFITNVSKEKVPPILYFPGERVYYEDIAVSINSLIEENRQLRDLLIELAEKMHQKESK